MTKRKFFSTLSALCLCVALLMSNMTYVAAEESQAPAQTPVTVSSGDLNTNTPPTSNPSETDSDAGNDGSSTDTVEELKDAMWEDSSVIATIAQMEGSLIAEGLKATVEATSEANQYVDTSKITMIGALLNGYGEDVQLKVGVPAADKQKTVDSSKYSKSVQLDISLSTEWGDRTSLEFPIVITMPLPAGLNPKKLEILHYNSDGTYEVEPFTYNATDNTITIIVSHFSTFVFAEKVDTGSGTAPDNGGGNNDTTPTNNVTAPKTGETMDTTVRNLLIAAGVFGLVAILCKKKEVDW